MVSRIWSSFLSNNKILAVKLFCIIESSIWVPTVLGSKATETPVPKRPLEPTPAHPAKIRPIIKRDNMLIMVDDDRLKIKENEKIEQKKVRFRTLGCYPLTAAVESDATTVEEIIIELLESKYSERQGRLIDNDQIGSMEKKKQEGYF